MVGKGHEARPSWDEYFLAIAIAVAARGDCRRTKTGAILVDRSRIVISTGYNGVDPGRDGCLVGACPRGLQSFDSIPSGSQYDRPDAPCIATHAESNSLRVARQAGQVVRLARSTAYITRPPCVDCEAELIDWGVIRAVFPEGEKSYGA